MGLNIEGATIGYDSNHLTSTLNHIHNNCVVKAQNNLRRSLNTLRDSVRECWQGKSADAFLANMEGDVDKLVAILDDQYKALEGTFQKTVSEMKELDEGLVDKRG